MSRGGPGDTPDAPTRKAWQRARVKTVASVRGMPVYIFCKDVGVEGMVIDAELHAIDLYVKSEGKIPLDLEICCPRCSEWMHVGGDKQKTIRAWQLEKPFRFRHPHDGEEVVQTYVVTVEEPMMCSAPAQAGKGKCGCKFRIQENTLRKA